jgi:hypothetical protein
MGTVWRAVDTLIERTVAIKELRAPTGATEAERASFAERALREARNAGRLNHPGVVAVHDVISQPGDYDAVYIVMEYVQAPSLAEILDKQGPLPAQRVAKLGLGVLDALDAAHAMGIVHRDIKPGNVLVAAGDKVKLTDFGIALAAEDSRLTKSGVIGTQAYLAPECFDTGDAGPAADLWALGATLYHAVAGRAPFDRATTTATLRAILFEEPPPPPGDPRLGEAISGLLTRSVDQRLSSAGARQLLEPVASEPVAATPGTDAAPWEANATGLYRPTPPPSGPASFGGHTGQPGLDAPTAPGGNFGPSPFTPTVPGGPLQGPPTGAPMGPPMGAPMGPPMGPPIQGQPMPPGPPGPGYPQPAWGQQPPPRRSRGKMWAVIAAVVVVLAGGGTAAALVLGGSKSSAKPDQTVQDYLAALASGDAAGALQTGVAPPSTTFLTNDILKQQQAKAKIDKVSIQGVQTHGDNARVAVNYTFAGKSVNDEVNLQKSNGKWVLQNTTVKLDLSKTRKDVPGLTVFGKSVTDDTIYVFPGPVQYGSSNPDLTVKDTSAGYFDTSPGESTGSYLNTDLSAAGRKKTLDAVAASLKTCAQSHELQPKGCPQSTYEYGFVPGSATWQITSNVQTLKVDTLSSDSPLQSSVYGPIKWLIRYRAKDFDNKVKSGSENVTSYVSAKVDIGTSPATVKIS